MPKAKIKGKPGRPRWLPVGKTIEEVEQLASQGLTLKEIAVSLGISYMTLNRKRKQFGKFCDAIRRGRVAAKVTITNTVYQAATSPEVPMPTRVVASKYWLNKIGGFRELDDLPDQHVPRKKGGLVGHTYTTQEKKDIAKELDIALGRSKPSTRRRRTKTK